MKKILSSVIIISMCLALVSCSGSTGNSSGEDIEIAKPDCADISTETYEDNALTMTVPSGWTVETYGSMGEYSIRCFDPADKSRQIFCYGCLSPILKSKEAQTVFAGNRRGIRFRSVCACCGFKFRQGDRYI